MDTVQCGAEAAFGIAHSAMDGMTDEEMARMLSEEREYLCAGCRRDLHVAAHPVPLAWPDANQCPLHALLSIGIFSERRAPGAPCCRTGAEEREEEARLGRP